MKATVTIVIVVLFPVLVYAQRVPRTVFPVHYDLTFTPHLAEETFDGVEEIQVSVQQPTNKIVLNSLEIDFKKVVVEANSQRQKAEVKLDEGKEFAVLNLAEPIPPGPATIHIQYSGKLNRQLRGFYIGDAVSRITAKTKQALPARKYAASQGESTDIRRAFPAFDEPEMKATFSVTMIVDKKDTAISNARIVSDNPGPGTDQHTIRFASTPRLSSYLVALLAGDFDCVKGEQDGIPLRICALNDRSSLGGFALTSTKGILRYYNDYYGIQYPFGKLDQIGIPDFEAGAMENAGAIVYRESALLADPKSASLQTRKSIASVIAHEMAHMWFGDLVTMRWWNDIWLNEGFATWMAKKPVEKLHPEWHMDLEEISESATAIEKDVLSDTRAIRTNAETSKEIEALFDSIAYQKTASLLRMVESYIGEENFQSGVNAYLKSHAFGNAESFDFFESLASASSNEADEVMNSFVNQAGIPLISVRSSCEGNQTVFHLRQQRFFENGKTASKSNERWIIPICMPDGKDDQSCALLREKEQAVRFPGCGLEFLNHNAKGYFITEYAPETEAALLKQSRQLNEAQRMVFSRDEWHLIMAGDRPAGNFLQLAAELREDRTLQFLESVLTHLQYIADYWITSPDDQDFRKWARSLLQTISRDLGTRAGTHESEERGVLRGYVWKALAVTAGDPDAIKAVRRMAENYLKDRESIDPNIATTILEAAAALGDSRLYEEIMSAYRSGGTPEENRRFLYTLAEFRDRALLQRTMAFALTRDVRSQDKTRLMAAVMKNPVGSVPGWNFLKDHWDEITKKVSDAQQLRLVQATSSLCDDRLRDEVREFFSKHEVEGSKRDLAQSLERISICSQARSVQQKNLTDWFQPR